MAVFKEALSNATVKRFPIVQTGEVKIHILPDGKVYVPSWHQSFDSEGSFIRHMEYMQWISEDAWEMMKRHGVFD